MRDKEISAVLDKLGFPPGWDSLTLIAVWTFVSSVQCGSYEPIHAQPPESTEAYAPMYPDIMYLTHREAEVLVEVRIDDAGNVTHSKLIHPVDTEDELMPYWVDHETFARRWKFRPGTATSAVIRFQYQLMPEYTDLYELGTTFEAPSSVVIRGRKLKKQERVNRYEIRVK